MPVSPPAFSVPVYSLEYGDLIRTVSGLSAVLRRRQSTAVRQPTEDGPDTSWGSGDSSEEREDSEEQEDSEERPAAEDAAGGGAPGTDATGDGSGQQ